MKLILLISLTFFTLFSNAQIVKLQQLASGELVDGSVLYDYQKDDIYGYFYIFQKDKVDKTEMLYEYVLLDKNLNKVSSGEFKDKVSMPKFSRVFNVRFLNDIISIQTVEKKSYYEITRYKYRLLDVKENKISENFDFTPEMNKNFSLVTDYKEAYFVDYSYNRFGYYIFDPFKKYKVQSSESGSTQYKQRINPKKIYFLNEKLEKQWSYTYNENADEKNYNELKYTFVDYVNDENTLVFRRGDFKVREKSYYKENKGFSPYSYLFFEKSKGKLISEISPFGLKDTESGQKELFNKRIFVDEKKDEATFLNLTMDAEHKKNYLDESYIQGFSRAGYRLSTGEEVKRSFFSWDQLKPHLDIDENGYIKDIEDNEKSYLYLHDVIMKENGNMLFITEQYRPLTGMNALVVKTFPGARIYDLIFFELDKDMKLVDYKKVEKEQKTIRNGVKMSGRQVDQHNLFDYVGYQKLNTNDFLFFYYNKQKEEEKKRKKEWVIGILSYINGKFSEQKIPLKSEDGSNIMITPAKKGYIRIYETFKDTKKSSEIRLEKINI